MKNLFLKLCRGVKSIFLMEIEDINFEQKKVLKEESLITDYNELYYPSCIVCLAHGDFSETLN